VKLGSAYLEMSHGVVARVLEVFCAVVPGIAPSPRVSRGYPYICVPTPLSNKAIQLSNFQ
jgi:hypothetical protein